MTPRRAIWTAVLLAAALVGTGGFLARPQPTAPISLLYGVPVTFAAGPGACVTAVLHPVTHHWICTDIEQSPARTAVPVVSPGPFPGNCTYVDADQHDGRWLCRMTVPADGSSLPDGPIVG